MSKTTLLGERVANEAINIYKQNCAEKGTNIVYCGNQKLTMPYVSDGDAWCVGLVQFVYKRALDYLVIVNQMPKTASVVNLHSGLKSLDYLVNNIPAVGCIGFRRTGVTTSKKLKDGSVVSHAFVVVEVGTNKIITVEGNTSDKLDFRYYPNSGYALSDHLFIHAELMGNTKIVESAIRFQLLQENSSPTKPETVEKKDGVIVYSQKTFRTRHFG